MTIRELEIRELNELNTFRFFKTLKLETISLTIFQLAVCFTMSNDNRFIWKDLQTIDSCWFFQSCRNSWVPGSSDGTHKCMIRFVFVSNTSFFVIQKFIFQVLLNAFRLCGLSILTKVLRNWIPVNFTYFLRRTGPISSSIVRYKIRGIYK